GGAAWAVAPVVLEYVSNLHGVELFAGVGVEREQQFLAFASAHRVEPIADDRGAGITDAGVLEHPDARRTSLGPLLQEILFRGDVVTVGAAPLGPVGAGGDAQQGDARERKDKDCRK